MFSYGFCDLNVNISPSENAFRTVIFQLKNKGYKTIAINFTLEEVSLKECKQNFLPEPAKLKDIKELDGMKVLHRLTAHISDQQQLYKIKKSPNFIKYDLFCVIPANQTIYQSVCGINDVDMISFLPDSRLPYSVNRKVYNTALQKMIYFEIPYGGLISDTSSRENIITNSHHYHYCGKSRNIVISSGVTRSHHVRGPYDVIHLGFMLGLDIAKAKLAITKNCYELIHRAEIRRRGKSLLTEINLLPELEADDRSTCPQAKKLKLNISDEPMEN